MRICVCLRQVPDPRGRLELEPDGHGVRTDQVAWVTDESDESALEEGLRLARLTGGEVTALTLGPERSVEALRRALALGASRAVRIDGAAPADPRHVAALLAAAIRRRGYDLVLTGAQSSDLGWGLTGTSLAAALGWPHVWLVIGIEPEAGAAAPTGVAARLLVTRELEHRRRERSRVALPAVLCVQTGLHGPRMPRIRDLLEAKRRAIENLTPDELAREAPPPPMARALELVSWTRPGAGGSAELCAGPPVDAARELVRRLRADGLVPERR